MIQKLETAVWEKHPVHIFLALTVGLLSMIKKNVNSVSVGCGQPPDVQHGELLNQTEANRGSFPPGALLMYGCDPGYSADGPISIICTSLGAWSHEPPHCIKSNSE